MSVNSRRDQVLLDLFRENLDFFYWFVLCVTRDAANAERTILDAFDTLLTRSYVSLPDVHDEMIAAALKLRYTEGTQSATGLPECTMRRLGTEGCIVLGVSSRSQ